MAKLDPANMNPLVSHGYNARNFVYLPAEQDSLNKGRASRTLGLSLPHNKRWEDFKDDPEYGEFVTSFSNHIDKSYTGEDREYMQSNAIYVNSVTLDAESKFGKMQTERHETTHVSLEELLVGFGFTMPEKEMMVRLQEMRSGNPETAERARMFAEDAGFTPEQAEEEFGENLDWAMELATQIGVGGTVQTQAEVLNPDELSDVARHEGFEEYIYADPKGRGTSKATIGHGINIEEESIKKVIRSLGYSDQQISDWESGKSPMDEDVSLGIVDELLRIGRVDLQRLFKDKWDTFPVEVQEVFNNMHFNLGATRFRGFNDMIKAANNNDYNAVADEMIDSKWYKQVGRRSEELVNKMKGAATK